MYGTALDQNAYKIDTSAAGSATDSVTLSFDNAVSVLDLEQNRLAADAAGHPHADDHLF